MTRPMKKSLFLGISKLLLHFKILWMGLPHFWLQLCTMASNQPPFEYVLSGRQNKRGKKICQVGGKLWELRKKKKKLKEKILRRSFREDTLAPPTIHLYHDSTHLCFNAWKTKSLFYHIFWLYCCKLLSKERQEKETLQGNICFKEAFCNYKNLEMISKSNLVCLLNIKWNCSWNISTTFSLLFVQLFNGLDGNWPPTSNKKLLSFMVSCPTIVPYLLLLLLLLLSPPSYQFITF